MTGSRCLLLPAGSDTFFGFEINRTLHILDFSRPRAEPIDFSWKDHSQGTLQEKDGLTSVVLTIPWTDSGYRKPPPEKGLKAGFYRDREAVAGETADGVGRISNCWIDPESPEISFHRPATPGNLEVV